ncbi:MAG TPA: NUDIX hydrolase [Pseudobacteroides sp.]|uniref:NUDIX hydrolase n=1 Tax=Pseudobacteroides sp. TaxID=1968840 RepID=UPI002F93DFF3
MMGDKLAYDGWLKVYKRKVGDREYDILNDYNAVAAIIVNQYNEILLVKQFRPALMEETLEIPAGSLDIDNEDEITCLIRELKEETGLIVKPESIKHLVSYKPMMGFSNSLMKIYHINVLKDEAQCAEIEDEDVYDLVWMGFDELHNNIKNGDMLDAKTILAFLSMKNNYTLIQNL